MSRNSDDEAEEAAHETTTLLSHQNPSTTGIQTRLNAEAYVIPLIYTMTFIVMLGELLQPAPRTQIYQSIVCSNHYSKNETRGRFSMESLIGKDCKVQEVQEELALLRGLERLSEIFPTVLAIPYGFVANKYGRRTVLSLSILGVVLGETWGLIVCWFSEYLPIRLIWCQAVFQIIGGGPGVIITMCHIIVTDVAPESLRTTVFLRIHAASMCAAILGPTFGSYLMGFSPWLPWFIGEALLFSSIGLSMFLPNTIIKEFEDPELPQTTTHNGRSVKYSLRRLSTLFMTGCTTAWASLRSISSLLAKSSHVLVMLFLAFSAQLGSDSIPVILLLYIPRKFGWDFAQTNLLTSLSASIQLVMLIVALPFASNILLQKFATSGQLKDLYFAFGSSAVLGIGAFLLGFAPHIGVAFIGVILMSMGTGLLSVLRSLLIFDVSAEEVSIIYSVLTIVLVLSSSLAGPTYSGTYILGLRLGYLWIGLPFIVAGSLFTLIFIILLGMGSPEPRRTLA